MIKFGSICRHKQLERQCEICELDEEISTLKAKIVELEERTCPVCFNKRIKTHRRKP